MVLLRKEHQGSDSNGHEWPEDGDVVDVPADVAAALTRIPGNDFTVVDNSEPNEPTQPADEPEAADDADDEVPVDDEPAEAESAPAARRPGRPRRQPQAAN